MAMAAAVLCTLGIVFYLLDMFTDVAVGLEDYYFHSRRLGLFEILAVVFTLFHQNLMSSNSAYSTEEELLRIKFETYDIEADHWKQSRLNWSKKSWTRCFYKLVCPYKVQGTAGKLNKLAAIIFNILTCLQLRPVVDRMVVILPAPTSLREYYHREAGQNSLRQFYLILEGLPELLAQFYMFQILYNNLSLSDIDNHESIQNNIATCYHIFTYTGLNSSTTQHVLRIFSMAIPFYNVPSGIASLENGFRRLDPLTPKMFSFTSLRVIFQASYMLMIPARLFMFAAVMHAVSLKEYVFCYIIFRMIMELLINLYCIRAHFTGSLRTKASTLWRLCLFSIRDVFAISLRDPGAYLSKPSEVSYKSLRNWENFATRAIPFICEGLIGALVIEQRYPCGKHSVYFKYLGWFCLISLLFSLSILVMVSGLFHPKETYPLSHLCNRLKKSLLFGLISIMISGIAALAFTVSKERNSVELLIMGVFILLNVLLNAGLILFIKKSKNDDNTELGSSASTIEAPSSSVQKIALVAIKETGVEENRQASSLDFDESNPQLDEPSVERTGLDVMDKIGSDETDEPDDIEENTPLLDESYSPVQNVALQALKKDSSKENVATSNTSDLC